MNIFVTRRIPEAGLQRLREAGLELRIYPENQEIPRDVLLREVRGAHALLTLISERIDEEVLTAAGPDLRVVANFAVGYNNIDLAAATARGVWVANTPDVLTDATADQAFMLLLAVARRAYEGDQLVRSGTWTGWEPQQLLGCDVTGKTLGIVGMGRIGRAMAERAKGFRMRLLYHNRSRDENAEMSLGVEFRPDLHALLAESDFVSLHVPLSEATRHLIGAAELQRMKPTAILINTARGAIVDEKALVQALRAGTLWGAGLDVFEAEPALTAGLAELSNVFLAPHLGSGTTGARDAMSVRAAENILAALQGRVPPYCLNPEARA